ncbi:MAG: DMT family transporter [Rhodobacteraceae bacterium]|nr:DMT family transporter [Paracoccaceae bacterium]
MADAVGNSPGRGIALKIVSVSLFMVMASLIKAASDEVPPGEAMFFRSLLAMPVILTWLALRGELATGLRTSNPLGHFWRGLVGSTAMGLGFAGLGLLPLPEVTAIGYAAPLLTVVFAAMFLNEPVGVFRLSTVGLGMVGVLIVLSPRLSALSGGAVAPAEMLGAIVVLTGAAFAALAQVFVRRLVMSEHIAAIVFYFSVTSTLLSLLTVPFGWVMPGNGALAMLMIAGVFGGLGQIFLTSSYRQADASVVAPFEYSSMLLALGVGYFVFDEVPSAVMLGGAGLIVLAGVLIILRERALGLERSRQRRAMTPQG